MTVIEGEVVSTHRVRRRNVARTGGEGFEVLPPDVQTKVSELETLSGAEQAVYVTGILAHAKFGLQVAIAAQDLPQIVEWKQKAAAIQEIAKQVRMGKEFQLDAAEFVRRAERGLGVAIREGQARGEVETTAEGKARGAAIRDQLVTYKKIKPKPTDFASVHELSNTQGGIYDLTDGVSDEAFAEALAEAREEQNLSRANVARKAKSRAKADVPAPPPPAHEPPTVRKTARARKTIQQMSIDLSNYALGLRDLNPSEVDEEVLKSEIAIIFESVGEIRSFLRKVTRQ